MTDKNIRNVVNPCDPDASSSASGASKPLAYEERERIRAYYRSLNFKEFLAACPIDGLDLTRESEYPREVEL